MSPQERNKIRTALQDLCAIPDEPAFDKTSAWDKLDAKRKIKPAAKLHARYLLAASIAAAIFVFLFTGHEQRTAPLVTIARQNMQMITQPSVPSVKGNNLQQHLIASEKKELFYASRKAFGQPVKPVVKITSPAAIEDTASLLQKQPFAPEPMPGNTVVRNAPKNQLHVVHLGELNEEDRMATKSIIAIRGLKQNNAAEKNTAAAGTAFRIYLKN